MNNPVRNSPSVNRVPRGKSAGSRQGLANTFIASPRRRRQQHLLDVRMRTREASRHLWRRIFYWSSLLLLMIAGASAIYFSATRGIARLFYQNPDYNIIAVNVETDGALSREQVLDCAGLQEGMNIFKVNLDRARERLVTLPQVQHAQIQRQLPNRVSITITERKPVAWIAPEPATKPSKSSPTLSREEVFGSKNSFLVDASGTLVRPQKFVAPYLNLPIIRGFVTDKMVPGGHVEAEEVLAALSLIDLHQNSLLGARFQILDIDVSRGYGLLATDRNNTQVFFALDDLELQLKTLETLLRAIDASGKRPATISLTTMAYRQRNIPVTYQTEVPVNAPATSNPASSQANSVSAPSLPPLPKANGSIEGSINAQKNQNPQPTRRQPVRSSRPASRTRSHGESRDIKHSEQTGGFRGHQWQAPAAMEKGSLVPRALPVQ